MPDEARRPQGTVVHLATDGTAARRIADAAVADWREAHGALAPIIGERGVAALFDRSLNLNRAAHPWMPLARLQERVNAADALGALHSALVQRTAADAASAQRALLQTFHGILAGLIGESLTARLLQPVMDRSAIDSCAQDPSP